MTFGKAILIIFIGVIVLFEICYYYKQLYYWRWKRPVFKRYVRYSIRVYRDNLLSR